MDPRAEWLEAGGLGGFASGTVSGLRTVWPWLLGPFVEAGLRVRGSARHARREARRRLLAPISAHREEAGLGHVFRIAEAESPRRARGCPAGSLGERLRLEARVLAEPG